MSGHRYAWLSDLEARSTVVLTSSRRLAAELQTEFAEQRAAGGRRAWSTPQILFWRDWSRHAAQGAEHGAERLISEPASALIWQRCIADQLPASLIDEGGLTPLARASWQRLHDWHVSLDEVERSAATQDEAFFARAALAYQNELKRAGWIDDAQLVAACPSRIRSLTALPERAVFAGFARQPPVVEALGEALRSVGVAAESAPDYDVAMEVHGNDYSQRDSELRAAGAWARQVLTNAPDARVAIVVADLHANATAYRRLVTEGYLPGWQSADPALRDAVNVSYGQRLTEYPMIADALSALRLVVAGLRSPELSALVRSPFLPSTSPEAVATLDRTLRRQPNRRWTAAAIAAAVEQWSSGAWAREENRFQAIATLFADAENRRSLSTWAPAIERLLTTIGWPGAQVPTSQEFQLLNRWRELLNQLTSLDVVSRPVSLKTAVAQLARCAAETVFQPETRGGRVQLLGVLEAAGMRFDHLWIAGMEAAHWPPAPNPLTLVSGELQRRRGMPDSTPDETLAFARGTLNRLMRTARSVHCSWARQSRDGSPQTRSPLLGEVTFSSTAESADPGWHGQSLLGAAAAEDFVDRPPPARNERLHGGARTLNFQLEEPFAAFALGRLGISEIDEFEAGLPPRLRGILFHRLLANLLDGGLDQGTVASWGAAGAEQRIAGAFERVYGAEFRQADALTRRLLALERARQRGILSDFLARECDRKPFIIEGVEVSLEYSRAGIDLRLRADRIDRVADGSLLLVDYKTGALKPMLNAAGDPVDIQLVLYAAAMRRPVGGLLLTYLRKPAVEYRGVGSSWNDVAADEWGSLLEDWVRRVEEACDQIGAGDVRLNGRRKGISPPQLAVLSRDAEVRRAD